MTASGTQLREGLAAVRQRPRTAIEQQTLIMVQAEGTPHCLDWPLSSAPSHAVQRSSVRGPVLASVTLVGLILLGGTAVWFLNDRVAAPLSSPMAAAPAPTLTVTTAVKPVALSLSAEELFHRQVAALSPAEQIQAVARRLKEVNEGWDGDLALTQAADVRVLGVRVSGKRLTNLRPLRALSSLQELSCGGTTKEHSALADLTPLKGLPLLKLDCSYTAVADLTPLQGMPLTALHLNNCKRLEDLTPLKTTPLRELFCGYSGVRDLTPLQGMRLERLDVRATRVRDLTPLHALPLERLNIYRTQVRDLTPLADMPLKVLYFNGTPVTDLTPLSKLTKLQEVKCEIRDERDTAILRQLRHLRKINSEPATDVLKKLP
jgi:hypothetical protein